MKFYLFLSAIFYHAFSLIESIFYIPIFIASIPALIIRVVFTDRLYKIRRLLIVKKNKKYGIYRTIKRVQAYERLKKKEEERKKVIEKSREKIFLHIMYALSDIRKVNSITKEYK